jgi:hypothetical protein
LLQVALDEGMGMSADAQDDRGYSEETCVRCGWRMGSPPLNCQNDNTPHRFPSQQRQDEENERLRRLNSGLTRDFNVMLVANSNAEARVQRQDEEIRTAEWAMNEHREMREAAEAKVQQLEDVLRAIEEYCDSCNRNDGFPSTVTLRDIIARAAPGETVIETPTHKAASWYRKRPT